MQELGDGVLFCTYSLLVSKGRFEQVISCSWRHVQPGIYAVQNYQRLGAKTKCMHMLLGPIYFYIICLLYSFKMLFQASAHSVIAIHFIYCSIRMHVKFRNVLADTGMVRRRNV
jgi:hypothetical protein